VKKVQHDGDDGSQHAGDGVPLDLQYAVHSGRVSVIGAGWPWSYGSCPSFG